MHSPFPSPSFFCFLVCQAGGWCEDNVRHLCPEGTSSALTGQAVASTCVKCDARYWAAEGSPICTGQHHCCIVQRLPPPFTLWLPCADLDCTIGYYCDGTSKQPCTIGTYGAVAGLGAAASCTLCPEGLYVRRCVCVCVCMKKRPRIQL